MFLKKISFNHFKFTTKFTWTKMFAKVWKWESKFTSKKTNFLGILIDYSNFWLFDKTFEFFYKKVSCKLAFKWILKYHAKWNFHWFELREIDEKIGFQYFFMWRNNFGIGSEFLELINIKWFWFLKYRKQDATDGSSLSTAWKLRIDCWQENWMAYRHDKKPMIPRHGGKKNYKIWELNGPGYTNLRKITILLKNLHKNIHFSKMHHWAVPPNKLLYMGFVNKIRPCVFE